MKSQLTKSVLGWSFLAGGVMLWLGFVLLPVHIGTFFKTGDFSAVHEHLRLWIWLFRAHIFGYVITVMALAALAAATSESESRILIWPGIAVAAAGLIVGALASAFYYHHGAWGALETVGYSQAELESYVTALRVDTEYLTCLVRFGRVFFGLGQVVLAWGLLRWRIVPGWLGWAAVVLGAAAMTVTMALPDNLEYYAPVFHLNALWLVAMGVVTRRSGLHLDEA